MVLIHQGGPDPQFLPLARRNAFDDLTPSFGEYIDAGARQTFSLNPTQQAKAISRLYDLDVQGGTSFINELGQEEVVPGGLDPQDPRARRMSVEEANEIGAPIGLRFSEPPTQGQFDYLADLKRSENERNAIISRSPSFGASAAGFVADLAASAVDPLNLAVGFVPVVGQARYAKMVAQLGKYPARAAKGFVEGAVGTAAIVPAIYGQAQILQQQYDEMAAFMDITIGGFLGSGLHVGGGAFADVARRKGWMGFRQAVEDIDPRLAEDMDAQLNPDRRRSPSPATEAPSITQAMDLETRARVQDAAVRAVANDQVPRVDEILSGAPELRSLQIPEPRFPATLVLRSDLTAADYTAGTRAAQIMEEQAERLLFSRRGSPFSDAVNLTEIYAKRYKNLKDLEVHELDPAEFSQRFANALEHPDQRALYDLNDKALYTREGASAGAIRHELERALDDLYSRRGENAGGYRYAKDDLDGQTAHRKALKALYEERPDRAPRAERTPEQAVTRFSDPDQPGLFQENAQAIADRNWDVLQDGKDKDLDRIMADEEIAALDSIATNLDGSIRDLGVLERTIPLEERQMLERAASRHGYTQIQKDLLSTLEEAVEEGDINKALLEAKGVLKDPDLFGPVMRGEKTLDEAIVEAGERQPQPEPKSEPVEGEPVRAETEPDADLDASLEDIADKALKDIIAKRELADLESQVVTSEHAELGGKAKTQDLVDGLEETEFNEARRIASLREGDGAGKGGKRAPSRQQREGRPLEEGLFAARSVRDGEAARGAGTAIERERGAGPSDAEAPETAQSIGAGTITRRVITPDGSIEANVTPTIVELRDLEYASGKFQPRDRTRKESDAEILDRARKLDPEQLMPTRVADAGAPLVIERPDGKLMIISGNGRVKSLAKTYSYEPFYARSQAYRERLGPAADGYRAPVLVLKITDAMTEGELIQFADRANRSRIAVMSSTERARRDAETAGVDIMMLYQGGEFTSADNRKFMNAFMRKVATAQEMGEMSKNGVLTKTGVDRLNAAVLASAYDDPHILSLMLESTDNNIKSIASAYRNVAPKMMQLRADIASGLVREEMDFTTYMIEAAHFIQKARDEGVKIRNALAQLDAFSQPHPTVLWLIRNYYDPNLSRAISALRITELLDNLVDIARQKRTGGFLEDTTGFDDVLKAAEGRPLYAPDEGPQPTLDAVDGGRGAVDRGQVPEPAQPRPGQRDGEPGQGRPDPEAARTAAPDPATIEARVHAELKDLSTDELKMLAREQGIELPPGERADIIQHIVDATVSREAPQPIQRNIDDAIRVFSTERGSMATREQIDLDIGQAYRRALSRSDQGEWVYLEDLRKELPGYPREQVDAALRRLWLEGAGRNKRAIDLSIQDDQGRLTDARRAASTRFGADQRQDMIRIDSDSPVLRQQTAQPATQLPTAPDFKPDNHPGRLKKSTLMREKKAALQAMNEELGLATTGNKPDLVARLLEDFKQKSRPAPTPEAARFEGLTDEQIDALPDPVEPSTAGTAIAPVDDPTRGAFYDFLEGTTPIKGAAHLARELGIAPDQAYRLLDEAVDAGWMNLRDDGKYVRVPKARRPGRPDAPDEFADIIPFGARPGMSERQADLAREQILNTRIDNLTSRSVEMDQGTPEWRTVQDEIDAAIRERNQILVREEARQVALEDDPEWKGLVRRAGEIRSELRALDEQIERAGDEGDAFSRRRLDRAVAERARKQDELTEVEAQIERVMEDVLERPIGDDFAGAPRGWERADGGFDPETLNRNLQSNLAIQRAVGEALHRVPDVIRFEVLDSMSKGDWSIAGMFSPMKRLIRVSRELGKRVARDVVNHEIVHALRHLRLFTNFEWTVVRQAAEAAGGIPEPRRSKYASHFRSYAEYRDRLDFDDFVENKMVEEWFATDHGEWAARRGKERETAMGRLHQRVRDFIEDLGSSFKRWIKKAKGRDVRGPENIGEIHRAIEKGTIAKRWQDWGMGRADDSNPLSVKSFAIDDMVDMTNRQLRELADEDSLSKGAKRNKAMEMLAPCAKHHL